MPKSHTRSDRAPHPKWVLAAVRIVTGVAPWAALAGAIGLAVVGLDDARAQLREWSPPALWAWASSNQLLVVIVIAVLTAAPTVAAALTSGVLRVDRETRRNLELTTSAQSHSSRIAHLITKVGDVKGGEVDDKYVGHTLVEACGYFKSRAIHMVGVDPAERVEAVILRANWTGNGRDYFARDRQTHTNPAEFTYKLSSHKNADAIALIDHLCSGKYFFADSPEAMKRFEASMKISPGSGPFKQFLAVPLMTDRKAESPTRVWGILLLMSTAPGMLRETDAHLLETYGWFVSAARAVDTLAPPGGPVSPRVGSTKGAE